MRLLRFWLLIVVLVSSASGFAATKTDNPTLVMPGPERMAYLLSYWLVEFKHRHPGLDSRLEVTDAASVARALTEGRARLAPMTRRLTADERAEFIARFGYPPTELRIALDALAVYVHRDNPLAGLTVSQLDAVFSVTRRCGHSENIFWWDQLGLAGTWQLRQIELYGPNAQSGAREVFGEQALCGGTHKATLEMARNASELFFLVARNPAAIAYTGFDARARGARAVPVAAATGAHYIAATPETIRDASYPLARLLYLYVNKAPAVRLAPAESAFVDFVLSPDGQSFAGVSGFVPLDAVAAAIELAKLRRDAAPPSTRRRP